MNWTHFHCGESFHVFMRDGDNHIQAYHTGDVYTLCTSAEFKLSEMLEGEVDRAYNCPQCDQIADQDHIRKCIGFKTPATREEIMDSLSHPTEHSKRDNLLRELENG